MDADLLGKRSPLIGNRHLNQKGGRNAIGIGGRNRIGMGGRNAIGISGRNQIGMGGRNVSESAARCQNSGIRVISPHAGANLMAFGWMLNGTHFGFG